MNQKIIKTKIKLKLALIKLLNHKTLDEITVKDIIETAQISRVTFYNHFNNKQDLLLYYQNDVLDSITDIFNDNKTTDSDLPKLYKIIHQVIYYIDDNFELVKILMLDTKFENKIFNLLVEEIRTEILKLSIDNQLNPQIPDDYIYSILISPLISVIKLWLNKENPETPYEIFDIIMKMRLLSPYDLLNINYKY